MKHILNNIAVLFLIILISFPLVTVVSGSHGHDVGEGKGLPIKPSVYNVIGNVSAKEMGHFLNYVESKGDYVRVLIKNNGVKLPKYVKVNNVYHLIPFISAEVPSDKINKLAELGIKIYTDMKLESEVLRAENGINIFSTNKVYPFIGLYPTLLNRSVNLVGASKLWEIGLKGKGVVVAVLDTGINKRHPSLDDLDDDRTTSDPKVIGEVSFVEGENADDLNGHGTYTASIIAGTGYAGSRGYISTFFDRFENATIIPGTQKGIAPQAYLLNVKVLNRYGYGYESWVIAGIEWAVRHGADIISMSLGGPVLKPMNPLTKAVEEAVRRGVVVITASGNDGPGYFSVSNPGNSPYAITVGAIYGTGNLAWFSGRGPTPITLNTKPDVLAYGVGVIGANSFFRKKGTFYISAWGTSPATAIVSGSAALLLQAFPGASPEAIKIAMMKTARDIGLDVNSQGAGIINVSSAYTYMKKSAKVYNEIKPMKLRLKPKEYRLLNGLNILFIGKTDDFSLFKLYINKSGATVNSNTTLPINLSKYNVLVICKPNEKLMSEISSMGTWYLSRGGGIVFIGDNLTENYENFTRRFGIHWSQVGLAIGGYSNNLVSHWITRNIKKLFLGGPLASLRTSGKARIIAYDPVYPAVALWENKTSGGRIVVLSDDDILNDDYLRSADNLKFGLKSVAWVGGMDRKRIHEISIGLRALEYTYNGSRVPLTIELANLGDYDENVPISLNVRSANASYFKWSRVLFIQARKSIERNVDVLFVQAEESREYIINLSAKISDFDPKNNFVNTSIMVIAKNIRAGENPMISIIHPFRIDSLTSPLVSAFPGEFKLLNLTFITSIPISNSSAVIRGNISSLSSFSSQSKLTNEKTIRGWYGGPLGFEPVPVTFNYGNRYSLGTGVSLNEKGNYFFKPIQFLIPANASIGKYNGKIIFSNHSNELATCNLSIDVKEPVGRLLFDDIFDYVDPHYNASFDAERLWGGVNYIYVMPSLFDWWAYISKEGYELDSLAQLMLDEGINDPWSVFLSGRYSSIVLFDKDAHNYEMSIWPKILNKGINLLTIFDGGFDGLFLMYSPTIFPEQGIGMAMVQPLNGNHPLMKNFKGTVILGGYTLLVSNRSEAVATGIDLSYGTSLSGAVLAVYKDHRGTKQVAFGDSNIFEYLGEEDFIWFLLYYYFNIENYKLTTRQLASNLVRYVSNKPPRVIISLSRGVVERSDQLIINISVDKPVIANLSIRDENFNFISSPIINVPLKRGSNIVKMKIPGNIALGRYYLMIDVIDEMLDSSHTYIEFEVSDLTPPIGELMKPRNFTILSGVVKIVFSCMDENLKEATLSLDNLVLATTRRKGNHSISINAAMFSDGIHTLTLEVEDIKGNSARVSKIVIIDNNPPSLTLLTPINGEDLDEQRVKISWKASDKGTGIKEYMIKIDSEEWIKLGLRNSTYLSVENGLHILYVKALDKIGHTSIKSVYFTVGERKSELRFRRDVKERINEIEKELKNNLKSINNTMSQVRWNMEKEFKLMNETLGLMKFIVLLSIILIFVLNLLILLVLRFRNRWR